MKRTLGIPGLLLLLPLVAAFADQLPRDRTVVLPEEAMQHVMAAHPQGAYLSYGEFLELWQRAHHRPAEEAAVLPPRSLVPIRSCAITVAADGELARADVTFGINYLEDKPFIVTVPDFGGFIEQATLGGSPALLSVIDGQTVLLLQPQQQGDLLLKAFVPLDYSERGDAIRLLLPELPALEVTVTTASAATFTVEPEQLLSQESAGSKSTVRLLQPNPGPVTISWAAPSDNKAVSSRRLLPEWRAMMDVTLAENQIGMELQLEYVTSAGGFTEITVGTPTGFELQSARHPDIQAITATGDQAVAIRFKRPVIGAGSIVLNLTALPASPPPFQVILDRLTIEPARRLDAELRVRGNDLRIASSYGEEWLPISVPADCALGLQLNGEFTPVTLTADSPRGIRNGTGRTLLSFDLDKAEITTQWMLSREAWAQGSATLQLPPQCRIIEVSGGPANRMVDDWTELAAQKWSGILPEQPFAALPYHLKPSDGGSSVEIQLPAAWPRESAVLVWLEAEIDIDPSQTVGQGAALKLQGLIPQQLDWLNAGVQLEFDKNLQVQQESAQGIHAVVTALQPSDLPNRKKLSYSIENKSWNLELQVRQAPTRLTSSQVSYLSITPSSVWCTTELTCAIEGAGISQMTVKVPYNAGAAIDCSGNMISEVSLSGSAPQTGDVWLVRLQDKVTGTYRFTLNYLLSALPGAGMSLTLPMIAIAEASGSVQYVGIEANEELELTVKANHMREIAGSELPSSSYKPTKRLIYAFQSVGKNPELVIAMKQYRLEAGREVVITSLEILSVLSSSGSELSLAKLNVLNRNEQYLRIEMPPELDVWSALVDSVGVKPARQDTILLIPLPLVADRAIAVEIVYAAKHPALGDGAFFRWHLPTFLAPVMEDRWTIKYPEQQRLALRFGRQGMVYGAAGDGPMASESVLALGLEALAAPFSLLFRSRMSASEAAAIGSLKSAGQGFLPAAKKSAPPAFEGKSKVEARKGTTESKDETGRAPSGAVGGMMGGVAGIKKPPRSAPEETVVANQEEEPAGVEGGEVEEEKPANEPTSAREDDGTVDIERHFTDKLPNYEEDEFARALAIPEPKPAQKAPAKPVPEMDTQQTAWHGSSQVRGLNSLHLQLESMGSTLEVRNYYQNLGAIRMVSLSEFGSRVLAVFTFLLVIMAGIALTHRGAIGLTRYSVLMFMLIVFLTDLLPRFYLQYLNAAMLGLILLQCLRFAYRKVQRRRLALIVVILLLLGRPLRAADASATAQPPAAADQVTVYAPYGADGPGKLTPDRRVFLTEDDFATLWREAHPASTPTPLSPIDFSVVQADLTGVVTADVVEIQGLVRFKTYADGWITVPWKGVGALETELEPVNPDDVVTTAEGGYEIRLHGRGEHPVKLKQVLPLIGAPSDGSVKLSFPSLPAGRLELTIPASNLLVTLQPEGAVSQVRTERQQTVATFPVSRWQGEVRWQPRREARAAIKPAAAAETMYVFGVGKPRLITTQHLEMRPGDAPDLVIAIPSEVTVLGVKGLGVKQWEWPDDQGNLVVRLAPVKSASRDVTVVAECDRPLAHSALLWPSIVGAQVRSESLALAAAKDWELIVTPGPGVFPIECSTCSIKPPAGVEVAECYGRSGAAEIRVDYRPKSASLEAELLTRVELADGELSCTVNAAVIALTGTLYHLVLALPPEMLLTSVSCPDPMHYVQHPESSTVEVQFPQGIEKNTAVKLELIRQFTRAATCDVIVKPCFLLAGNASATTSLTISTSEVYSIEKEEVTSGRGISCTEFEGVAADSRCYRFEKSEGQVNLHLTRNEGEAEATIASQVKVTEDGAEVINAITYTINRGFKSSFLIESPVSNPDDQLITGEGIRAVTSSSEGGKLRSRVELTAPARKSFSLHVSYRLQPSDDGWLTVPAIAALEVNRSQYQVAVLNYGLGELEMVPEAMLRNLPQESLDEVMPGVPHDHLVRAFTAVEPWRLKCRATALESVAIVRSAIDHVSITSMIYQSGFMRHQVSISMINKREQYLRLKLPPAARLLSVEVAQRPVRVAYDGEFMLVPLIKTSPWETSFKVDLVYEQEAGFSWGLLGWKRLTGPEIVDIPVSRTLWTVYMPDERLPYWFRGNMEQSFAAEIDSLRLLNLLQDQERIVKEIGKMNTTQQSQAVSNLDSINRVMNESLAGLGGRLSYESEQYQHKAEDRSKLQKEYKRMEQSGRDYRQQIDNLKQTIVTQNQAAPAPPAALPLPATKSGAPSPPPVEVQIKPQGQAFYFKKLQGNAVITFLSRTTRIAPFFKALLVALIPVVIGWILFRRTILRRAGRGINRAWKWYRSRRILLQALIYLLFILLLAPLFGGLVALSLGVVLPVLVVVLKVWWFILKTLFGLIKGIVSRRS